MSLRIRGQEITIRIAVDGATQNGSFFKVKTFTATPRTDLQEADYIGEAETDIDVQHHGYDATMEIDIQDAKAIDFMDDLQARNEAGARPADITCTVMYKFREAAQPGRIIAYHEGMMKLDEDGVPGRKERVTAKFSLKFKTRQTLTR
jgi:hypothetical protein